MVLDPRRHRSSKVEPTSEARFHRVRGTQYASNDRCSEEDSGLDDTWISMFLELGRFGIVVLGLVVITCCSLSIAGMILKDVDTTRPQQAGCASAIMTSEEVVSHHLSRDIF